MKRASKPWPRDRGAALVMVLTTLALMSALAIVVVDAANMSLRRTSNLVRMEQTRWYLMGAEAFASGRLAELRRRSETAKIDAEEWHGRPFVFPLDDGQMEATVVDGSNCFNLNAVVSIVEGSGVYRPNARGMSQFARLVDLAGARGAQVGLAAALADWIDSDGSVTAGGAEDANYGEEGSYITANTLIADVSELRAIRGFDEATIQRLAPYVCVRPTALPNRINPNTLTPEQAPLLSILLPDMSVDSARQVIRSRPRGGWEDVDAFLRQARITSEQLTDATREQFSLQSQYYVVRVRVQRDGASESSTALIDMGAGREGVVVRRVLGVASQGQML